MRPLRPKLARRGDLRDEVGVGPQDRPRHLLRVALVGTKAQQNLLDQRPTLVGQAACDLHVRQRSLVFFSRRDLQQHFAKLGLKPVSTGRRATAEVFERLDQRLDERAEV